MKSHEQNESNQAGCLLAVHAHPDDETLTNAALLATSARQRHVVVVTCTRGEQGEVIPANLEHLTEQKSVLAKYRSGELRSALVALGVREHYFLDEIPGTHLPVQQDSGMGWVADRFAVQASAPKVFPPGALCSGDLAQQAQTLAKLIVELKPTTVVTYDPNGGYGHPDHVRAHQITVQALRVVADSAPEVFARIRLYWTIILPEELIAARAEMAVYVQNNPEPFASLVLPQADLPAAANTGLPANYTVSLAPVIEQVLLALKAYPSQIQGVVEVAGKNLLGAYALSNKVLVPLLNAERYARIDLQQIISAAE